ncbi:MAG TPA: ABC transporter permease, partial [Gammaproteobacteria bacterium]|nr:ABC transporter permease [Gammaproteobacteria bacterium]
MSVIDFLGSIGRDLRHAARGLARRPAFTMAAVLTLAIGIGATTAIFSVVYSVLIKPLPYPNAGELVRIRYSSATLGTEELSSSTTQYFTYRAESRTIAEIGLWGNGGETVTTADGTERIRSLRVTYGVLQALAVQPARGRWFTEQEHGPAAEGPDPLIVSYGFAQSRYGSDSAAIGRDLTVNGRPA